MRVGYAILLCLAIAIGAILARYTQRGLALRWWQKLGVGLGAFSGAMLGAKLPFLFEDPASFLNGWSWFQDGKTILTGLVGGYLGVEVAKWSLMIQVRTGDSFVLPVAAAIAVGRLGCFWIGCCYGRPTEMPWGVVFSQVDGLPRHPTQLYEAAFHLIALFGFWRLAQKGYWPGQRIKLYVILYAAYRFWSEWWRPEEALYAGLTGYQFASLWIIGLFVWLWWRDTAGRKSPGTR